MGRSARHAAKRRYWGLVCELFERPSVEVAVPALPGAKPKARRGLHPRQVVLDELDDFMEAGRQVAELCELEPEEAARIIRSLVADYRTDYGV